MSQTVPPPFVWTSTRHKAAQLLANGRFTDREIAARIGVSRRTLARWKRRTEFAAHVDRIVREYAAALERCVLHRGGERAYT